LFPHEPVWTTWRSKFQKRGGLDEWMANLDQLGVGHSPVRDLGNSKFVSLEDPDGIQIELWHTIVPNRPADEPAPGS
jgi:hypothetical protein